MTNNNETSHLKNLPFGISLNEIVVAIWVSSSFYIMYATGGENASLLFLALIGGAAALILLTYKKPVIATVPPLLSLGAFLLNISILCSYLCNKERYECIFIAGNMFSSLLLFASLYLITTKIDLDFRKTLIVQCVLISLLLPVVLATAPVSWGRVKPPTTPNYVGMMALLAFSGALSVRSVTCASVLAGLPLYSILVLQSRDSLIAAAIAFVIVASSLLWRHRSKKFSAYLLLAFFGSLALCFALVLIGVPVLESLDRTFEGLFMLNDERRGIGSGASGRSELWAAAVNLWLTNPFFGVGFKGHQMLMPDQLWAHNAYLGMLADLGLAGLASYLLIISPAIGYIFKRKARFSPEYPQRAMIILTYLFYGIFESRAFSFGNSYSVIFMLTVFDCSKRRLRSEAPAPGPNN